MATARGGGGGGGGGGSGGSTRKTLPDMHTIRTFLSFVFDFYNIIYLTRSTHCALIYEYACAYTRIDALTYEFPAVVHPNIMNK